MSEGKLFASLSKSLVLPRKIRPGIRQLFTADRRITAQNDPACSLHMLPAEIWVDIFSFLRDDRRTLVACAGSCKQLLSMAYIQLYTDLHIQFLGTGSDNSKARAIARASFITLVRRLRISFTYDRMTKTFGGSLVKYTRHSDMKLVACILAACTGLQHLRIIGLQMADLSFITNVKMRLHKPITYPCLAQLTSLYLLRVGGKTSTFGEISKVVLAHTTLLVHLWIGSPKDEIVANTAHCKLTRLKTLWIDGSSTYMTSVLKWTVGCATSLHTVTITGGTWSRGCVDLSGLDQTLDHLIIWDKDNALLNVTVPCLTTGPRLRYLTIKSSVRAFRPGGGADSIIQQVWMNSKSMSGVTVDSFDLHLHSNFEYLDYFISTLLKIWVTSTVPLRCIGEGKALNDEIQKWLRQELRVLDSLGKLNLEALPKGSYSLNKKPRPPYLYI